MKKDTERNPEDMMLSAKLLKNITYLVDKSNLMQHEIAEIAKSPRTTLNGIIVGNWINPKLHSLAAISRVFDIDIGQLIG